MKIIRLVFFALVATIGFSLSGCSNSYRHQLSFNNLEPIRVAVLPFVQRDEQGRLIEQESRLFVDSLNGLFTKVEETPAQVLRKLVQNELNRTQLDIVSPALIDIDALHHGYGFANGKLDVEKLWATKASELCTLLVNCDAVMYGTITHWNRSYYGLESVSKVGLSLHLVSALDDKVIFSSEAVDTDSRGLSKGPTGFSSLVLEPIKGLDSAIIVDLARKVVRKQIEPLVNANQQELAKVAPPLILASGCDARNGIVEKDKPLIVLMFGSDALTSSFSIGNTIGPIPMIERSPGNYYGEYIPLPGDSFTTQRITVRVSDRFGRVTTQEVPRAILTLAK